MKNHRGSVFAASVALTAMAIALAPASSTASTTTAVVDDSTGTYYQVQQQRLLDTRAGIGAAKAPVGPGQTVDLQVTSRANIPTSGVAAVVLNLTAVVPTANTYLTSYPTGGARPTASSLNLSKGATRANLVTVPVGAGGKVSIFNAAGSVNILADVLGFYSADDSLQPTRGMGTQFQAAEPDRLFDSRADGLPLSPGEVVSLGADFGPELNPNITALALNVTALAATKTGYIQVWPENVATPPNSSTVNFAPGQVVPNMVVAPASYNTEYAVPAVNVKNSSAGTTHVIVDIVGFYDKNASDGLRYRPIQPTRIIDTRNGTGGVKSPLASNQTRTYSAPASVAGTATVALVANTTAVQPTLATYLTVWDGSSPRPGVSNLNAKAQEVVANATIALLDDTNAFNIYNNQGLTNVVMDVAGAFEYHEAATGTPSGSMATAEQGSGAAPGFTPKRLR